MLARSRALEASERSIAVSIERGGTASFVLIIVDVDASPSGINFSSRDSLVPDMGRREAVVTLLPAKPPGGADERRQSQNWAFGNFQPIKAKNAKIWGKRAANHNSLQEYSD
jgi:hypothetical protein